VATPSKKSFDAPDERVEVPGVTADVGGPFELKGLPGPRTLFALKPIEPPTRA
jgi:hypothetical protein